MNRIATLRRVALLAVVIGSGACQPGGASYGPAPASPEDAEAIRELLERSTEEWNRGNLEGFVLPYDSATTFVTGNGVLRGKGAVRNRYGESYFRTGTPTGVLSFRDLEVKMLGRDYALVIGRYVVSDRASGQEAANGIFSLTMVRRPEGWRILHDHSS